MTDPYVFDWNEPPPPRRSPAATLRAALWVLTLALLLWPLVAGAEPDPQTVEALAERHFPAWRVPWVMRTARCESGYELGARSSGYDRRWRVYYDFRGPLQVDAVTWQSTADELGYDLTTADGSMAMAAWIAQNQGVSAWPVCGLR